MFDHPEQTLAPWRRDAENLVYAAPSRVDAATSPKIRVENLDFWYGETHALKDVSLDIYPRETTALIGPSGCGKSTFLLCLNRMHDDIRGVRHTGRILMDGADVYDEAVDPPLLRRRFGWVAQKPNPFPLSVYENVAYGMRLHGLRRADEEAVASCLERAGLWDELKDRLREPGTSLSGGQQQRLCIARALSVEPEVLLMDEPCGSLDPRSTARIEELITELSERLTILIITHNMEQAARVAQRTAFFHSGRVLEAGPTRALFTTPQTTDCARYLAGRFG